MSSDTSIRISLINGKEDLFALFLERYSVPTIAAMNQNAGILSFYGNKVFVRYLGTWTHVISYNPVKKRYFIVVSGFLDILAFVQETFNSEIDPTTLDAGLSGQLLFYNSTAYIFNGEAWETLFTIEESENSTPPVLTGELSLAEIENRTVLLVTQQMQEIIPVFIGALESVLRQEKGAPNGLATLGEDGKLSTNQLPDVVLSGDVEWVVVN